ncbi:cofilin-1-B-like [Centropristis striata]|uniref:cofilin-1-B-like n=1 Tax=Centropristis striata TaxID=184440 RepID=UPI0027E07780|nr:cofilin-1-B-like [Centropristis striata]
MASGVEVEDQVKDLFNEMKVHKNNDDDQKRPRVVVFDIDDGKIRVKEILRQEDLKGDDEDVFKVLKTRCGEKCCCYVLYDCHYELKETGKREDLIFFSWTPSNAGIRQNMVYASSREALKKIFTGVKHFLELHETCELSADHLASEMGKDICSMEGHEQQRRH